MICAASCVSSVQELLESVLLVEVLALFCHTFYLTRYEAISFASLAPALMVCNCSLSLSWSFFASGEK